MHAPLECICTFTPNVARNTVQQRNVLLRVTLFLQKHIFLAHQEARTTRPDIKRMSKTLNVNARTSAAYFLRTKGWTWQTVF